MLIDLLIALVLGISSPPTTTTSGSMPSWTEQRTGKIVLYGPTWGDWTCPATEKCGIAARQNVRPAPGEWCVATWYRTDRNRTGTLRIGSQSWRVRVCDYAHPEDLPRIQELQIAGEIPWPLALEIPGLVQDGWVTGTLVLGPSISSSRLTSWPARWPAPIAATAMAGTATAATFSPRPRPARDAPTMRLSSPLPR